MATYRYAVLQEIKTVTSYVIVDETGRPVDSGELHGKADNAESYVVGKYPDARRVGWDEL
jgi:hypothetical protein